MNCIRDIVSRGHMTANMRIPYPEDMLSSSLIALANNALLGCFTKPFSHASKLF